MTTPRTSTPNTSRRTKPKTQKPKAQPKALPKAPRPTARVTKPVGKTSRATSKVLARRPRRSLRVVIMMSDEEQGQLLQLCDDDVRPVSSWFRVVVRRAWQARKPAKKAKHFQRREDDGLQRQVEVWTRLSEEERDQLDVLAGEEDVSAAVWFRRRLREGWALYQRAQRKAPQRKAPQRKAPQPRPVRSTPKRASRG